MFFLALLSVLMAGEVGIFFLGALVLCTIWMVHSIHSEFRPGGSGFSKLWPTGLMLVALFVFCYWAGGQTGAKTPEGLGWSAFGLKYFSMGFWGWVGTIGEYLLIGLAYSIFEMRVTLWRDKKNVVTKLESYVTAGIRPLLSEWLLDKLGSSKSGPETGKVILHNGLTALETYAKQQGQEVKQKVLGWEHVLADVNTWQAIFHRVSNPKQLLENAAEDFKADVKAMEAALSSYVDEAKHEYFNPHTAYLKVLLNTDGTLDVSIKKADLAICLFNWTVWWWAYLLNLVLGDMIEMIYTKIASWVIKVYGSYVKKYFADITAIKV